MRQLVTVNARLEEHTKYFDILMLMATDMKEKLDKAILQDTTHVQGSTDDCKRMQIIFSMLPVSNNDTLKDLTEALTDNSSFYDQTVKFSIYVTYSFITIS